MPPSTAGATSCGCEPAGTAYSCIPDWAATGPGTIATAAATTTTTSNSPPRDAAEKPMDDASAGDCRVPGRSPLEGFGLVGRTPSSVRTLAIVARGRGREIIGGYGPVDGGPRGAGSGAYPTRNRRSGQGS